MNRERLVWADALKGWLALLVIFGHALQFGIENCNEDYIWNLIYSAQMPAFFAISGFLAFKGPNAPIPNWGKAITRRMKQLLLPFFVWTVIDFCTHDYGWSHIKDYFLHPDCMYWFLWTLFFIYLIFISVETLSRRINISTDIPIIIVCLLLSLSMIVFNYREFGFQFIAYYFLFYAFGFFINKYNLLIKNKAILLALTIVWLLAAYFWRMDSAPTFVSPDSFIPQTLWLYSYRFAVAVVGVVVLMSFAAQSINLLNSENKLVKLGVYSLGSYVVQLLFIPWVVSIIRSLFYGDSDVSIVLVSFGVTAIISVAVISILNMNRITALFCLGKITRSNSINKNV